MGLFGQARPVGSLRDEVRAVRRHVRALSDALAAPEAAVDTLLAAARADVQERASLAAVGGARLRSDALSIEGDPELRMRIRRIRVGDPVERVFSQWAGVTRCVSTSPDVRELWDRLIAIESSHENGTLQGGPSTVLDVPDAVASIDAAGRLNVTMQRTAIAPRVLAIPKFTYALPPRKLRNFGHWLVDCVPQVAALSTIDPGATFLVPSAQKPFQEWAVALTGVQGAQLDAWDGRPVGASRLLVFESDGRAGGGRPLSALTAFRRQLLAAAGRERPAVRRIYVSRRDARNKRKWFDNQPQIEELFRSRGFEVLSMADCPLDEQARIFRDAQVVAGISGAGLTDVIFSAPGTHLITLLSDSLIRWYADRRGARSLWAGGGRGGHLAELGDSPRFYAHLAAAFEQYGHTFVGGDAMPIDQLAEFVDEVLARVDAA